MAVESLESELKSNLQSANRSFGNCGGRSVVPFTRCSTSHAFKPTDDWSDVRLNLIRQRRRQPSTSKPQPRRLDEVESISALTSTTIIRLDCESRQVPTGRLWVLGIGCWVSGIHHSQGLSQVKVKSGARVVESPEADTSR